MAVVPLLAGLSPAVLGQLGDTDDADAASSRLFAPTLGRPAFVAPGDTFQVMAQIPDATPTAEYALVYAQGNQQRYPLQTNPRSGAAAPDRPIELRVPPDVPPRTYDLEIRAGSTVLRGRHCVAVGHIGALVRIVHLSNLNIGDPGALRFDERLIAEINLVAPTLIVATGDYLDALHTDPQPGWQELASALTQFHAPLLMACGEHDDIGLYSRYVAPSPVGLVNMGPHRCIVLYDHLRAPVERNAEQLRWLDGVLSSSDFAGLTFVTAHSDYPNLLEHWQRQGVLEERVRTGRLALWFAGGHTDWDNRAYCDLLERARPLVYLRTHQSSHAPRAGATGISHYRIVDIADNCVILPETRPGEVRVPPSTPLGHLRASVDGRNDGSEDTLAISVVNNLPYRLNGLAQWIRLRKVPGRQPWCLGGRLDDVCDLGDCWECCVRLNAPDKGSARALAGSGPQPPAPRVSVQFQIDSTLVFEPKATIANVAFASLIGQAPIVHLTNPGDEPLAVSPLIRLDGNPIPYRPAEADATFATTYRLHLAPGDGISLQLDLSAATVEAGRRELQVYLRGLPAVVPICQPVRIVLTGPADSVGTPPTGR